MKIAIASGKGGTGKTTIATNMALSLNNVQLLDCDVEEPNSQLFLNLELEILEEVNIIVPKFDPDLCDGCKKCAQFCQYNAIAVVNKKVLFFQDLCHGCGGCKLVCPVEAISDTQKQLGVIKGGKKGELEYFQGLLDVGEMIAIPVLRALKERTDDSKTVILDAPPGTACPPIETITGSDYVILVTEPTPFGLHDLELAVEVVRKIGIPFGVIVNREGVGDDRVDRYCRNENIPMLMKIPQDRKIAELYSNGIPFVNKMPEWKKKFQELVQRIRQEVEK